MFIFNEETGKLDIQKMRTNGSLPTDSYKFFDDALVKVAKQELQLPAPQFQNTTFKTRAANKIVRYPMWVYVG